MNILVKSNDKFYFQVSKPWSISQYGGNNLIDGKEAVESEFNKNWYESSEEPKTITRITTTREYTDYTLKDEYKHLNLPPVVDKFEADEDDELPAESLFYTRNFVEKKIEDTEEIVWDKVISEDVSAPATFVGTNESRYGDDKLITISPASSLVDSLIHPQIVLPSKACAITGDQMYKIVRYHIKQNINPHHAKITSDYDFCFTVRKLLAIPPQTRQRDVSGPRARKPRYQAYTISDREVTVFEMTPPSRPYDKYTPIKGVSAKSHAELKKKLEKMLAELMDVINEPLKECTNCEGTGVLAPKKVDLNG